MADIFYMPSVIISFADPIRMVLSRAVARHNNWGGGGGGGIFIYSESFSKEKRWAEHEYMNMHPPPQLSV
jgi:hypothetical protein